LGAEELLVRYGAEVAAFITVIIFAIRTEMANRKTRAQNEAIMITAKAALTTSQANQQEAETSTRKMVDNMTEKMYSEMRARDNQYNGLLKEFSDIKVENALLKGRLEGSEKANKELIDHLKQSLEKSEADSKATRETNQLLERQIATLNDEKTRLENRLTAIEADIHLLRDREAKTDARNIELTKENAELVREKEVLLERIAELEKRVKTIETEKAELQARVDHLENELKPKRESPPEPVAQALVTLPTPSI
jgi:chromosome segregation ATPase